MDTITLANARQQKFYQMLLQHRLPFSIDRFLGSPDAPDFLQALLKMRVEKHETWSLNLLKRIRVEARKGTADQVKTFAKHAFFAEIWPNAMSLPFTSDRADRAEGTSAIEALTNPLIQPDALIGHNIEAFFVLLQLVILQEVTHSWRHLVEGVKNGEAKALELFERVVMFGALIDWTPRFVAYSPFKTEESPQALLERVYGPRPGEMGRVEHGPGLVPVPEDCVYVCNNIYRRLADKTQASHQKMLRLVTWFEAYQDEFQRTADQFWLEIQQDAKYGLRAAGDLVRIKVEGLHCMGYRYLELFPQQQFPETIGRYWIVTPGDKFRITVQQMLTNSRLVSPYPNTGRFNESTDCLQKFIAIHSLWKIITGRTKDTVRHVSTPRGERKRQTLDKSFKVRPHFRWLPPGYQPSERALQRSIEALHLPPQGKTFVMSDLATEVTEFREPEESPTIVYTGEDLGYAEE